MKRTTERMVWNLGVGSVICIMGVAFIVYSWPAFWPVTGWIVGMAAVLFIMVDSVRGWRKERRHHINQGAQ